MESLRVRSMLVIMCSAVGAFTALTPTARAACAIGAEVAIPTSDGSAPQVALQILLPDGSVIDVLPGVSHPDVVVPSGTHVTLRAVGRDAQGVRDAQLWIGTQTCAEDLSTGTGSCSGPGLLGQPSANNPDGGGPGATGCSERQVMAEVIPTNTHVRSRSFEVSATALNFGNVRAPSGSVSIRASERSVACAVFDNGYAAQSAPSGAVYFAANERACIPDGSATGTCRRWFGQCVTTADNQRVTFEVFNDGQDARTLPADAIYNRASGTMCIADGSPTGTCRRWFGNPRTTDGKAVECYVFDDGESNMAGPSTELYFRAPGQVCLPDGSPTGLCRRWFGHCVVTERPAPALVTPPPPPPQPSPGRQQCLRDCAAERDECMRDAAETGGPRPQQCVAGLRACRAGCPNP